MTHEDIYNMTQEQTQALTAEELATWTPEQIGALTIVQLEWLGSEICATLPLNPVQLNKSGYMTPDGQYIST